MSERAFITVGEAPRIPVPQVFDVWRRPNDAVFVVVNEVADNIVEAPRNAHTMRVTLYCNDGTTRELGASASGLHAMGLELTWTGEANANEAVAAWNAQHHPNARPEFTVREADARVGSYAASIPGTILGTLALLVRKGLFTLEEFDQVIAESTYASK